MMSKILPICQIFWTFYLVSLMKSFTFVSCKHVHCSIFFNVPILSAVFQSQGYETTFNTGWSSAQNSEGDRVLSLEAALVIAHGKNTTTVKIITIIFFLERSSTPEVYTLYDTTWSLFALYNIKMLIETNLLA